MKECDNPGCAVTLDVADDSWWQLDHEGMAVRLFHEIECLDSWVRGIRAGVYILKERSEEA